MTLTDRQRTDRLRKRLLELELWTVAAERPLEGWSLNGKAHAHGAPWPTREGVVTLALAGIEVPEDWPLEETRLDVHLGGEGLLRIAYPDGGGEAFGLDPNHERFPVKGRRFDVAAECVARLPFGVPNRAANLARARLIRLDPDLAEFVLLVTQVADAAHELDGHEVVSPMLTAVEDALAMLDWPSATLAYVARVAPSVESQRIWELPEGPRHRPGRARGRPPR